MTRLAGTVASKKRAGREAVTPRMLVTLFALIAFTFQTFVVQTHIHGAPKDFSGFSDSANVSTHPQSPSDKLPPGDDPANCSICQQILHAGNYVTPSAIAVALPTFSAATVFVLETVAAVAQASSHGWQSRAPPAH